MDTLLQVGCSNALMAGGIAAVAFAAGRLSRRPALAHALWLLVLLKLVTPPLVTVPLPLPVPEPTATAVAAAVPDQPQPELPEPPAVPAELAAADPLPAHEWPAAGEGPPPALPEMAQPDAALAPPPAAVALPDAPEEAAGWAVAEALAWVWLGGAVLCAGLTILRLRRFRRALGKGRPAPRALQEEARGLAERLGLKRCPEVWVVPAVVSPHLWAAGGRARLVLPDALLTRMAPDQRAALLVHELAHWRRRDHWVRWLELAVTVLYWWFPVAWWARRELHEAEEECCDAWVVWALPGSAKAYALALVETMDFLAEARPALPVGASGLGPVSLMRRRLTMILRGTPPRALCRPGLLAVLGVGALLLPLLPTWAQSPTPPPRRADPNEAQQQVPPRKGGDDLERQRDLVRKLEDKLKHMRDRLDEQQRELDERTREFQRLMDQLRQGEGRRDTPLARPVAPRPVPPPPAPQPPPAQVGQRPDVDRRLANLERQLDVILREIQALRSEMPPNRPGGPPRDVPGVPGTGPGGQNSIPGTGLPGTTPSRPGSTTDPAPRGVSTPTSPQSTPPAPDPAGRVPSPRPQPRQ